LSPSVSFNHCGCCQDGWTLRSLVKLIDLPAARKRAVREPKLSGRVNRISSLRAVPASKGGA
jgi:hypothetical protein